MSRCRLTAALLALPLLAAARAENLFQPYLNDEPPRIVEVLSKEVTGGIEVTHFRYLNRVDPVTGRENLIYSVLARPTTPGPHPAVLVCHGGGGSAAMVTPQVIGWAKRGYVSVCQDQPGICSVKDARSSGPALEGRSAFTFGESPLETSLYDGVAAALNGLRLLRSAPDVDKSRVGVTGGSWGGYMTTMIAGLAGDRVKASFSVYGCGFYDLASQWQPGLNGLGETKKALWLEHLDAGRRTPGIRGAHMVATATNDWFFWPPAMQKTYEVIGAPGKNICFMPNDSHALTQPGGTHGPPAFDHAANRTWMEQCWLNYHLKGAGPPFPSAAATAQTLGREDGCLRVRFAADGPLPFTAARVWYAAGELPWRLKWWSPAEVETLDRGFYEARIPVDEPAQPLVWFGIVTDRDYRTVSTLIQTIQPTEFGFRPDEPSAARFGTGFENPEEHWRLRRLYLERRPGRHSFVPEAARTGHLGLAINGEAAHAFWGTRAATLQRQGAKAITLWLRAADGTCPPPTFDLLAEAPDSQRYIWRWPADPTPLTTEWREVVLPFDRLEYAGKDPAPVELWSGALGQFRIHAGAEANFYLDDLSAR